MELCYLEVSKAILRCCFEKRISDITLSQLPVSTVVIILDQIQYKMKHIRRTNLQRIPQRRHGNRNGFLHKVALEIVEIIAPYDGRTLMGAEHVAENGHHCRWTCPLALHRIRYLKEEND